MGPDLRDERTGDLHVCGDTDGDTERGQRSSSRTGAMGFGVITGDVMRQGQAFAEGGYGSAHLALLGGFPLLAGSRVVTMVCSRDNKLSCL